MSISLLRLCAFPVLARRFCAGLLALSLPFAAWAVAESYTWLGLPLSFKAKEYAFRSGPALELRKFRIETTQPIQIGQVWLKPDWGAWLTEFNTRKLQAEADEIVATPAALMRLGTSDGRSSRVITSLHFSRLKLVLASTTLDLPAGEMDFLDDATLSRIRVDLGKGIQLALIPSKDKLELAVQTERLTLPLLPALAFDSAVASGAIDDTGITIEKLGANGDGGSISGVLRIGLDAEKAVLSGDLEFKSLSAKSVIERLYPKHVVDGLLFAQMKVGASAKTLAELGNAPIQVAGNYTMKAASIDRFGLLEGMRKNDPGVAGGGLIRSESFNGSFSGASGAKAKVTFGGIKSGALQGWGNFTIDPEGKLAGVVGGSMHLPNNSVISHNFVLEGKASAPVMVRR